MKHHSSLSSRKSPDSWENKWKIISNKPFKYKVTISLYLCMVGRSCVCNVWLRWDLVAPMLSWDIWYSTIKKEQRMRRTL